MQEKGFKLSAEDIYSVNRACMKDAVVSFNGGCTAELISAEGLLITNHHCGYDQIQEHSSLENDYLTNGFWAMSGNEELPNPGVTVTLLKWMEDVTARVLSGVADDMPSPDRENLISANIENIVKQAVEGTSYKALVRPFFMGNQFFLFVNETFRDVRLVGAPPSSIGKFGGDTDNWIWPRHTGDFSLFRVYADSNNSQPIIRLIMCPTNLHIISLSPSRVLKREILQWYLVIRALLLNMSHHSILIWLKTILIRK